MSTHVFNPDRLRSTSSDDDDDDRIGLDHNGEPKTLGAAKELLIKSQERVSFLQKEVASLRAAAPPATSSFLPPGRHTPGARRGNSEAATAAPTATTQTAMEAEVERARQARLEGLTNKPLSQQSARELQAALNAAEPEDRGAIYAELKSREGDTALRAFKASRA